VLGTVIARLPTVQEVRVSGPAIGGEHDQYLFNVKVTREQWDMIHFDRLHKQGDVGVCHGSLHLGPRHDQDRHLHHIDPFKLAYLLPKVP
jgi:hypothetical protein